MARARIDVGSRGARVALDRTPRARGDQNVIGRNRLVPPPRTSTRSSFTAIPSTVVASTVVSTGLAPLAPVRHVHFSSPYSVAGPWWGGPRRYGCWSWWTAWPSVSFSFGFGGGWIDHYPATSIYYSSYYDYGTTWCSRYSSWPYHRVCFRSPRWYRTRASCWRPFRCWSSPYSYTYSARYGFLPCYSTIEVRNTIVMGDPAPAVEELTTVELRFCEGWSLLRSSEPEAAAEVLYSASIEAEQSALVHWFLGLALARSGDLPLASHTVGAALALDPRWLSHRWNAIDHLGEEGVDALHDLCASRFADDPLDPDALAIAGALALLDGDAERTRALRGRIAESLLLAPESPALAEILAETRRRTEGTAESHPALLEAAWLARPSCDALPSLELGGARN